MKYKVSGAIAIPRQAGDVPQPCRTGFERFLEERCFQLRAAGKKKFFDPEIFQKFWRGSGRVALIAARRQRNPCAILLAHGAGGEKSDSFSRRGEQDRSTL